MAGASSEYITSHRRSARAQACCNASLASAAGKFEAMTENVGALGCRLVAPWLVRRGEPVHLEISHPGSAVRLRGNGRVTWTTASVPWRLGIAFDEAMRAKSVSWFSRLVAGGVFSTWQRVPDRIPVLSTVYLGVPPRFILDVTSAEMALLRETGTGLSIAELMARFTAERSQLEHALFSLLAQRLLTLSRGDSVHPRAWSTVFAPAIGAAAGSEGGRGLWSPLVVPMVSPERWLRR